MKGYGFAAILALVLVGALAYTAGAADSDKRLFDRAKLEVSTGTAYIDTSAATYTSFVALVTITPDDQHALMECKVVIDLDKATTGFADATGYDSETIQFCVERKVDGTNWRAAKNLELPATALAADDADNTSVELDIGLVGPDEDVRVSVKLSAEAESDVALPYVVYYRSGARATITAATN